MRWLPLAIAFLTASVSPRAPASDDARAATPSPAHGPAHPPLDGPARGRATTGGDPHRPFDDTSEYIEHLEQPERAAWQKPDEVIAALHLRGDETVFDVGAGSGYFTFRFAKVLPRGKVVAVDVDPEMVRHVRDRARDQGVGNVQAVLADPDDPAVDTAADVVFACNVLHHVGKQQEWLRRMFAGMRPGARLVVLEFKEGKLPVGPPESVKIPARELASMLRDAGFVLRIEDRKLLPYQTLLVLERPTPAQAR